MPNKYLERKGIAVPKQKYKVTNWTEYSNSLKRRGDIEICMSDEAIEIWYHKDQSQDGSGKQEEYTDFAIKTCHEIRKVFHLPLRQSVGFIDSIFRI